MKTLRHSLLLLSLISINVLSAGEAINVTTKTDAISCSIMPLSKNQIDQLMTPPWIFNSSKVVSTAYINGHVGTVHTPTENTLKPPHRYYLPLEITIENNSNETICLEHEGYIKGLKKGWLFKDDILKRYNSLFDAYASSIISSLAGIILAATIPSLYKETPGGVKIILGAGSTFCIGYGIYTFMQIGNLEKVRDSIKNAAKLLKKNGSVRIYLPKDANIKIPAGATFKDIIFLDIKRVDPDKLENKELTLKYSS